MSETKRRQFVKTIGLGSAGLVTAAVGVRTVTANQGRGHQHDRVEGPLASATVSFGAWPVGLDRTVTPNAPMAPNIHDLIPNTVTIKAGGTVNYVIAGFHQVVVYRPSTTPSDINIGTLLPVPGAPPTVGLIDDPVNRVYRGISPIGLPQDRVEVVSFDDPGVYLVICAVNIHFLDDMFGWVRVLRG